MFDKADSICRLADMKTDERIQRMEQRIEEIKTRLSALGDMRPGSLSKQYNVCGKPGCRCKDPKHPQRHGPYHQLSYVHQGKSTSQFIRPHLLKAVRDQVSTYKTFRKLTDDWIRLALNIAKLKLEAAKKSTPSR
jgi:hypothetical protein